MLEQTSTHESGPSHYLASLPGAPALSAERLAQTEAYLDHLCSLVAANRPGETRQEIRAELETRLMPLIVAHQELGHGPEEALLAALQQLRREYTNTATVQKTVVRQNLLRRAWRTGTLLPLGLFGAFYTADVTQFAWRVWSHVLGVTEDGNLATQDNTYTYQNGGNEIAFYRFELFVIPLLVGLVSGLLLRQKARRGVLNALALLAIPAILVPGFFMGLNVAGLISNDVPVFNWIPSAGPGVVGVTFWVTLGYSGAVLGDWLSRQGGRIFRSRRKGRAPQKP